jgi:hypothetical protein
MGARGHDVATTCIQRGGSVEGMMQRHQCTYPDDEKSDEEHSRKHASSRERISSRPRDLRLFQHHECERKAIVEKAPWASQRL